MAAARKPDLDRPLARGWTTGACATAATKAALTALLTGEFPDPVTIRLPRGETPAFPLAREALDEAGATAGIVKDAGDDPDVTHGATILSTVRRGEPGMGIVFRAGEGVGTVTKPGLPVAPGEAAINPVPRTMMRAEVETLCTAHGLAPDITVTIAVPGGEAIARQTWNPRLGIVGGLSILGTTGIVHPFSCSAWIHSIHSGVDVARAAGYPTILAATGSTSEAAARRLHPVPDTASIDMGDFAGGLLKYLRNHPVPHLVLAGGFAKMVKLAQGALDLHSGRSQVDFEWLADAVPDLNQNVKQRIRDANTAAEVLAMTRDGALATTVAQAARETALAALRDAPVAVTLLVVDRAGTVIASDG